MGQGQPRGRLARKCVCEGGRVGVVMEWCDGGGEGSGEGEFARRLGCEMQMIFFSLG